MSTTKEYPPERLAELPYVYRDEYDEPYEDWGLRSEFTRPSYVGVEDGDFCVAWRFGPQGHPGSMQIYLHLFLQDCFQPRLHVLGPDFPTNKREDYRGPFPSSRHLKSLLIYGHRLQERFGTDPFWHQCGGDKCSGGYLNRPPAKPPYQPCPDCRAVSARAKEEVRAWMDENPFPQPPAGEAT